MRRIARLGLALGVVLAAGPSPVAAAKYAVSCTATPSCKTACSSNTYEVACYARVVNGRCEKACGRVR
jgi:hypothetical protein